MTTYTRMDLTDRSVDDDGVFDAKAFYRDTQDCLRVQLSRDELTWVQNYSRPDQGVDVVLNLSCGAQATPHVMLTQVALFEALEIDFVATGGQQYCCGKPFQSYDLGHTGDRLAAASISRLASWRPTTNVQCCGSCLVEFQHHVGKMRADTGTAPFEVVHITDFLLDTLRRLGDAVPWRHRTPLRVLLHAEGAEVHSTKEEARTAVIETLDLMPDVEYVGMVENPSRGKPCGQRVPRGGSVSVGGGLNDLTPDQYREVQAELEAQARAVGADAIVTHHHKCHREWSKLGSNRLPVIHYQSLLAEALGIDIPDRFQTWWRLGDLDQVLEASRPNWESWQITETEARQIVTRHFSPAYASAIQRCPCEAAGEGCFETPVCVGNPSASSPPPPAQPD